MKNHNLVGQRKSSIESYILKKSRTSGDIGDAPDKITRTRPPRAAFTLLNTNRSHMGEAVFPEIDGI